MPWQDWSRSEPANAGAQTDRSNVTIRKHESCHASPSSIPRRCLTDRPPRTHFQHSLHSRHLLSSRQRSVFADRAQTVLADCQTTPRVPRSVRVWLRTNLMRQPKARRFAHPVDRFLTHVFSFVSWVDGRNNGTGILFACSKNFVVTLSNMEWLAVCDHCWETSVWQTTCPRRLQQHAELEGQRDYAQWYRAATFK